MSEQSINEKHKDRLFNFIFGSEKHKDWTLSLYNAVNNSHYTDPDLIKFNTLKDVLFLNMKNDTSFIISDMLSVYEHQSTYCPNMPLRMMDYVGRIYSGYITVNKFNKYGSNLIPLPTPKLVVFYNGTSEEPDETLLRLSDSFSEETRSQSDIEVKVRMLNVNYGRSKRIMSSCKPLKEFAWLIDCIRKNQADTDIATAARNAVRSMPDEYLIKQFLIANLEEVIGMLDTEYNEAEIRELFRADAYREFKDELDKNAATIAEKNATIAEKDAALADKDAALADKDALISKLQAELKSLRDR